MFKCRFKKALIALLVAANISGMPYLGHAAADIEPVRISADRVDAALKQCFIPIEDALLIRVDKLEAAAGMQGTLQKDRQRILLESGPVKAAIQFIGPGIEASDEGIRLNLAEASRFQVVAAVTAPDVALDAGGNALCFFVEGAAVRTLYVAVTLLAAEDSLVIGEIGQAVPAGLNDRYTMLVNKDNRLAQEYKPEGMAVLSNKMKALPTWKGMMLEKTAGEQLAAMLEQAYQEGIRDFTIVSAYRPFEDQKRLFNNKVAYYRQWMRNGYEEEAAKVVAIPGASEHQTGLAVDIGCKGSDLVEAYALTPQGRWLADNSWKFGYVLRYQKSKTDITGIIFEPWHFRYVGYPHARFMYENDMALEEYLAFVTDNGFAVVRESNGIYVVSCQEGQIHTAYFHDEGSGAF